MQDAATKEYIRKRLKARQAPTIIPPKKRFPWPCVTVALLAAIIGYALHEPEESPSIAEVPNKPAGIDLYETLSPRTDI